jgi:hypothetical protein
MAVGRLRPAMTKSAVDLTRREAIQPMAIVPVRYKDMKINNMD